MAEAALQDILSARWWAVAPRGVLLIWASSKLDAAHGRIWLLLAGIASLGFAALLVAAPIAGATLLTWCSASMPSFSAWR